MFSIRIIFPYDGVKIDNGYYPCHTKKLTLQGPELRASKVEKKQEITLKRAIIPLRSMYWLALGVHGSVLIIKTSPLDSPN